MKRLAILLLLAVPCFGLKTLTTSAAFTDAQGNPCVSCYIVFNLSRGANLVAGGDVVPVPPITINIGVAGILIPGQQIIGNDEMQPTGTYYIVRIFNANNVLVRGPEKWIISGASPIDLSLMIDVTIPDPGLGSPVIQNPSQAQSITGFPFTFTSTAPLTVQGTITSSGANTWSGAQTVTGNTTNSGTNTFSGANTFSGSTTFSGATSFTGASTLTLSNPGVFTNTQMNEYVQSLINSCSPSTEYSTAQAGNFATDAMAGCITTAAGTVHQTNGVAGYAVTNIASNSGGGAVGGYFQGRLTSAGANTAALWGINPVVLDAAGETGSQMIANESDINVNGAPARAYGMMVTGASTGTIPALGSSAGIEVRGPGYGVPNSLKWPASINVVQGSGVIGVNINPTGSGNSLASMPIQLNGRDSGGTIHAALIVGSPGGTVQIGAFLVANLPSASANPGGITQVTDSTAVAAEGQTCAGGGTTIALAFSNGTVWKCF